MKEWLVAALGSLFLAGSSTGAAIQNNRPVQPTNRPASTTRQVQSVDIACVGAAVAAREAALSNAAAAEGQTVAAAYATRAEALNAAYSGTDAKVVRDKVKRAWEAFSKSTKEAHRTFKSGRENAWKTFRTAAKACKGGESIADSGNASAEVQTQQ